MKILSLLLGAYVDGRDRYGQTALHWCARNGQGRCAQLLVSRGAGSLSKLFEGVLWSVQKSKCSVYTPTMEQVEAITWI